MTFGRIDEHWWHWQSWKQQKLRKIIVTHSQASETSMSEWEDQRKINIVVRRLKNFYSIENKTVFNVIFILPQSFSCTILFFYKEWFVFNTVSIVSCSLFFFDWSLWMAFFQFLMSQENCKIYWIKHVPQSMGKFPQFHREHRLFLSPFLITRNQVEWMSARVGRVTFLRISSLNWIEYLWDCWFKLSIRIAPLRWVLNVYLWYFYVPFLAIVVILQ